MRSTLLDMARRADPYITFQWSAALPFGADPQMVEAIDLPFVSVDTAPVFSRATNTYYATISDIGSFDVTFYADVYWVALAYVSAWKKRIQNSNGTYNMPHDYKGDVEIFGLDPKGVARANFKLIGCFPTSTTPLNFQSESSTRLQIIQSFSADSLEMSLYADAAVASAAAA